MKLYNSLTRTKEEFVPLNPPHVGLYTCGPTVYSYPTIGNWRTYVLSDVIYRTLKYLNYDVTYVMNVTDVGHLTGDNLGDSSTGEDRLEKASRKEGKTAWEIAAFYTDNFKAGLKALNIEEPLIVKATDNIPEQIELVKKLENKGFTYKTSDGIYFDVGAYEKAEFQYGQLSTLDKIQEGARVEVNIEKKDPRDFALWKFSPKNEKRQMEWESPWGTGFPGWHIECSAMSMKYLGAQFDIHAGGEDLRSTHHPNEIAQSEGATGKHPFVKYWLHGAFLQVDGGRMGKSRGNAYTLEDIQKRGISLLALRYFYFTASYRQRLNFTWEGLGAAAQSLENLYYKVQVPLHSKPDITESEGFSYKEKFTEAISDDLNMPVAISIAQELVSKHGGLKTEDLMSNFDKVLGINFAEEVKHRRDVAKDMSPLIVKEVSELLKEREEARLQKDFKRSDELRDEIKKLGYEVKDTASGQQVLKL